MEVWSLGNVWLGARVLTGQVNPECIAHHTIGSSVTRSAAFVNINRKLGTIITIDEGESFLGGFNIHLSLFSNRPNTASHRINFHSPETSSTIPAAGGLDIVGRRL